MKKVIVFDLDDTLYTELEFVKSGFKAVSKFLFEQYRIPVKESNNLMLEELEKGRGEIFNNVLRYYKIYSKDRLKKCVSIYRLHKPSISLDQEAKECLRTFKDFPKYVVTDGNKLVQFNKVHYLGLEKVMKHCFITHRYGVHNAKPSTYCFFKICELESVNPENVVYIADNPKKDFVGIKTEGFKTVRILKGPYKDLTLGKSFEADLKIKSLRELNIKLIDKIFRIK